MAADAPRRGEYIVSMTTWPPRAAAAAIALEAIIPQAEAEGTRVLLALSEDEFPNKESDLPERLRALLPALELVWDKGNRRSHKKLMPALERHPDSAVLVADDDFIMRPGWLNAFLLAHKEHPRDILFAQAASSVVPDTLGGIRETRLGRQCGVPGVAALTQKPANGAAGTLYPPHTFTRPEFFDPRLYMELSPTSDETWQYAFAVMEGRTLRCMPSHNSGTRNDAADQNVALYRHNATRYTDIHNAIARRFPEYAEALRRRIPPVVASMASHGRRLPLCGEALRALMEQEEKAEEVMLNYPAAEARLLPPDVLRLANEGRIRLCPRDPDRGPHNKYLGAFREHPDALVLTADDDTALHPLALLRMREAILDNPDCVVCARARVITRSDNGSLLPYRLWPLDTATETAPSTLLLPTGCDGAMYHTAAMLPHLNESDTARCPKDDDIYLRHLAYRAHLRVKRLNIPCRHLRAVERVTPLSGWWTEKARRVDELLKTFPIC